MRIIKCNIKRLYLARWNISASLYRYHPIASVYSAAKQIAAADKRRIISGFVW